MYVELNWLGAGGGRRTWNLGSRPDQLSLGGWGTPGQDAEPAGLLVLAPGVSSEVALPLPPSPPG